MKTKILAAVLALAACAAHASGLDALEAFIKNAKTGRATFTQVVTGPQREGQPARTRNSTGSFEFARPNKFRFDYKKPFEQVIVADGQTLWLHDVDLNQVTARKQDAVLGSTPAALIASAPDLATLKKDFDLQAAPDKDGLQWVQATPKNKEGQLRAMALGFRGNELARLEITDGFGQRSQITFDKMELNAQVPAERFQFKPPQGAAVVKQ
ncbi:outer membrane lipoprotein chaperone LolA [Ramlibacter sp. PS4R-6]|uniref:outer membrane lipoprotein chaperone LolA n=1 Tax=Ramlibacter sp. PS4R-6 TaxID=3133438 RepID=UPI0030AEBA49